MFVLSISYDCNADNTLRSKSLIAISLAVEIETLQLKQKEINQKQHLIKRGIRDSKRIQEFCQEDTQITYVIKRSNKKCRRSNIIQRVVELKN